MSNYEKVKKWRKLNKEKVNAQARRYRKKHPAKVKIVRERYRDNNLEKIRIRDAKAQAKIRKKDPEGYRRRYLKWREKKEEELTLIAGRKRATKCELCNESIYRIVFDHCHISGNFRGWICDRCNKVLGLVKDSPLLLLKMKEYLEIHNVKVNCKTKK